MSSSRPDMRALLVAMFVSSIPSTLMLPMIPSLGAEFDVAPAQLGLLVGIYPLMSMLVSPFWGRLSDRYGRKPILIATLFGGALAFVMFAVSTSWVGLFIGRAMQGLAGTPRGIGFAVASDMSDDENRSASIGKVTAAMAIAFTVGPLIGGLFMGENPESWTGQLRAMIGVPPGGFNHVLPSLMGALLNLLGMLTIIVGFRETWHAEAKRKHAEAAANAGDNGKHSFAEAILHIPVILAVLFFLLSGFIQGSVQFAFTLWADMSMGWTAQWIAWTGMSIGLGFAIGSGVVLKILLKRLGQEKTVLIGTLIDAAGLGLFLLYIEQPLPALLGLTISSLGGGLWATTILGLMSRDIDPRDQGLALGVANGAALFGRVMGPAFAGFVAAAVSPGTPFVIIFGCVALAIVRGATLVRSQR